MSSSSVTATIILQQTVSYLEQLLSQPELRQRILTSARLKLPSPLHPALLQSLALISQSLQNSPSAEKLLLSLPTLSTPLSALLLSLTYTQRRRHVSAALVLLDIFVLDPQFARSELAPPIYENLFIPHLLPAIQWFSEQRSRILLSCNDDDDDEDGEEEEGRSMVFEAMSVLSRMSAGQAEELRMSQKGYEVVMDENCRIYAEYLKKVLEGSDDLNPPQLVSMKSNGELNLIEEGAVTEHSMFGMEKGQYNNVLDFSLNSLVSDFIPSFASIFLE